MLLCLMLSPALLMRSVVARRRSLWAAEEADQWSPTKPSSALFDRSGLVLEDFFASLFNLLKSALYSLSLESKGLFLSGGRLRASKSMRLICSRRAETGERSFSENTLKRKKFFSGGKKRRGKRARLTRASASDRSLLMSRTFCDLMSARRGREVRSVSANEEEEQGGG